MFIFDNVFHTGEFKPKTKDTELEAIATSLGGWANCMAGAKPPEKFGAGMAALSRYIHTSMIPEDLSERADYLMRKK